MRASTSKREWTFYALAAFFALYVLFVYGPMAVIYVLSFQGREGGMTFPMNGVSTHWFADLVSPGRAEDIPGSFRRSNRSSGRRRELECGRKQFILEDVYVNQHEKAAASVRIYRVTVIAVPALSVPDSASRILVDHHRSHGLDAGRQQGMPVVRGSLIFGAGYGVGKLRGRNAAGVMRVGKHRRLQNRIYKWAGIKKQPLATGLDRSSASDRFAVDHPHKSR